MSLTSKSPRTVACVALEVGRRTLPEYAHRFAPKTFTQPQLFACLVLKAFFRTDYRGIEQLLNDLPELRRVLGLSRVPDHSTLHKAAGRLFGKALTERALDTAVRLMMRGNDRIDRLAIDSSGFEARHVSRYFVRRRKRCFKTTNLYHTMTYRRWPKLAVSVDCDTHLVVSLATMRGPNSDIRHIERVIESAWRGWEVGKVYADAGYDGEWVHQWLREDLGAMSLIPAKIGRPTSKPPSGRYRRWMSEHLGETDYGQRWQVETVFSMIKRNLGDAVNATGYWSQSRSLHLLAVTHNIMILLQIKRFSTEHTYLFFLILFSLPF
ncbi:MAG: transposase [Planctomycetota bacterium]